MFFGLPASTFFGIVIWPFVWIIASIIIYYIMKKQDDTIDDSEFEQSIKGRSGDSI